MDVEEDEIDKYQDNLNTEIARLKTLQDSVNHMKLQLKEKKARSVITATQAE
jgi:hypothetical protein